MLSRLIVRLATIGFLAAFVEAENSILLHIDQGPIRGSVAKSFQKGISFYSFTGIPYAKALNETTRFLAPEPPEPWSEEFRASTQGSECSQWCFIRKLVIGKDNCLFLSVYTTEPKQGAGKAVMFWIHGGSFKSGSGLRRLYGPDFLVEQDVVVVSINYRLGALGFLSTEDAAMPGNVGLKDQVAALKWVQKNIHHFGGDPKKVTIFGESAGGAAVHYHLLSPMSKGLFSAAIMQSGSALNPWAWTSGARASAFALGKQLGIVTDNSVELVRELQKIPTSEIVKTAEKLDVMLITRGSGRAGNFVPSVEPVGTEPIFLPDTPWAMMLAGKIHDVPIIVGCVNDEARIFRNCSVCYVIPRREDFDTDLNVYVPGGFNITEVDERKKVATAVKEFYLGRRPNNDNDMVVYDELLSDMLFNFGIRLTLEVFNQHLQSPIYDYLFNFPSPTGFFKKLPVVDQSIKDEVTHADELCYIFYSKVLKSSPIEPDSAKERVIRLITKLWTNFAKTRNPTPVLDEDINVKWEPYGNESNYATIVETLTMGREKFADRMKFWQNLYNNDLKRNVLGDI